MAFIDRYPIIRAHQHAASGIKGRQDHAIGRSRGGLSTKINALAFNDETGLPVRFDANRLDKTTTCAQHRSGSPGSNAATSPPLINAGYDANALLDLIRASGAKAHIPSTSQRLVHRSVDPRIYRQRNLVERFFCKIKHFRRIATRFDKLARNFLAAVALVSTRLWTRAYESTT